MKDFPGFFNVRMERMKSWVVLFSKRLQG